MSSRPLGWSRNGADKMARLRIYKWNQGNMLDLVRFQKQEISKAAGAEEEKICTLRELITAENAIKWKNRTIYDQRIYSVPYTHVKKIAWLKDHIWGL